MWHSILFGFGFHVGRIAADLTFALGVLAVMYFLFLWRSKND